ncbi:HNH endonuclease [Pigmentibacter sp. JX0631]|uniref:HNH endonuclease n=1 Tax=Pigmentibacter sp. JX0631 TaxID=2976982 RepID=UPI002468E28A|nr:HNH endonuclease [Pigmentibacter sp. JX0631]WGL60356.1 HNH endonuclease [Pigmentibacter sp. JX0631]
MGSFERKVLVLDSRYEPVKIVTMELGFVLLYAGRVTSIMDSERQIQGVAKTWKVPWIVRLNGCRPRTKRLNGPRFSRQNVYLRDGFRCQYCMSQGGASTLTLDHLLPSAKGGKTTWENIVTACKTCNMKKGSKTIEELGIKLQRPPSKPQLHPTALFPLRYGITTKNAPQAWLPYLDLSVADRILALGFDASPLFVNTPYQNEANLIQV